MEDNFSPYPPAQTKLVCVVCHREFSSMKGLATHFRTHTCIRVPKARPVFQCHLCEKKYYYKNDINEHINVHFGWKPHKCKECDQHFCGLRSLRMHVKSCHEERKYYPCSICDKQFATKLSLKVHIRSHLNLKPFKCTICPKTFSANKYFKKYLLSHTGEKPHVCDVCQKRFSIKYNLRVHYRIHTGEKPFVCTICDKAFRVKLILDGHYKTHGISNESNATV
nr:oocyte zinc finger protein XlCOF15-like [Parasteatoda tepidariorum]